MTEQQYTAAAEAYELTPEIIAEAIKSKKAGICNWAEARTWKIKTAIFKAAGEEEADEDMTEEWEQLHNAIEELVNVTGCDLEEGETIDRTSLGSGISKDYEDIYTAISKVLLATQNHQRYLAVLNREYDATRPGQQILERRIKLAVEAMEEAEARAEADYQSPEEWAQHEPVTRAEAEADAAWFEAGLIAKQAECEEDDAREAWQDAVHDYNYCLSDLQELDDDLTNPNEAEDWCPGDSQMDDLKRAADHVYETIQEWKDAKEAAEEANQKFDKASDELAEAAREEAEKAAQKYGWTDEQWKEAAASRVEALQDEALDF